MRLDYLRKNPYFDVSKINREIERYRNDIPNPDPRGWDQ
jgi:hypothetical protein